MIPVLAWAQAAEPNFRTVLDRIAQVETQVNMLSKFVYANDPAARPKDGVGLIGGDDTARNNAQIATINNRVEQLDAQVKTLVGQIEELDFKNRQLTDQLTSLQAGVSDALQKLTLVSPPPATQGITPATPDPAGAAPAAIATPPEQNGDQPLTNNDQGSGGKLEFDNPSTHYNEAMSALRRNEYDRARSLFDAFIAQYPQTPLSDNAYYWRAETDYVEGKFDAAAQGFAKAYQAKPESRKAADNLMKLALSLDKINKRDDACVTLGQLINLGDKAPPPMMKRAKDQAASWGCSGL
jgi:tol-pal system protein YbgF